MTGTDIGADGPRVFWKLYRQKLDTMNNRFNRVETQDGTLQPRDGRIDALLQEYDNGSSRSFEKLYAAEQRLIETATPEYVDTEAARRFEEARLRQIDKVGILARDYSERSEPALKREVLLSLVDELQLSYTRESLDGTARQKSSDRLNNFAIGLVIATLIVFLLSYVPAGSLYEWLGRTDPTEASLAMTDNRASFFTHFHLLFVMWFGVIGAYFSRLISFRFKAMSMDRDALATEFSRSAIYMRLTIGFFSAIIMYLLISANILSGSLFPKMDALTSERVAEVRSPVPAAIAAVADNGTVISFDGLPETLSEMSGVAQSSATEDTSNGSVQTPPSPNEKSDGVFDWRHVDYSIDANLALLLVWSLLAGFSERLIPDRFRALEKGIVRPGE